MKKQLLRIASAVVLFCTFFFAGAGLAFASYFNDVPDSHWAQREGYINRSVEEGLIKGVENPDGTRSFMPDAQISRAQVANILARMNGVDTEQQRVTNTTPWSDAANNMYYTAALNWAYDKGILTGSDGKVRPDDPITREELCATLARYASKINNVTKQSDHHRLLKYPDNQSISSWARDDVSYCTEQGIIGGSTTLNPGGKTTRAEAVKMILVLKDGGNRANTLFKSHYIDVGQGDSIFLELGNGQTMLIDAGPTKDGSAVINTIRSLGYSRIDYVVMTHPDADHIGGMASVLNTFNIGKLYAPKFSSNTQTFENLLDTIATKGLTVTSVTAGMPIVSSGSLNARFIWPKTIGSDSNNNSAMIELTYGSTSWLYPGDGDAASILAASSRHYDVLKVSHHGANDGTTAELVSTLSPRYAVISCGAGNAYGHPTDNTLSLLGGVNVFRTDLQGTVSGYSDGSSIWFDKNPVVYTAPSQPTPSDPDQGGSGGSTVTPGPSQPSQGDMVYVTPSGKKYHRQNCSTLKNSKTIIPMPRFEAIASGRDACKVCKP